MQSGYRGGGGSSDFYTAGAPISSVMGNQTQINSYAPQVSGIFFDPTAQIGNQTSSLVGKRSLAEFQMQQQNQALNSLVFRSVKPRNFLHSSPVPPPSPVDFSSPTSLPLSEIQLQRLLRAGNGAILRQNRSMGFVQNSMSPESPYTGFVQNRVPGYESEKDTMNHRLQALEKLLLDDEDDGESAGVSVITNTNSEWSETFQNLMNSGQNQKQISPSPSSSTSSSSSSTSSVVSPASECWKQSIMEAAACISDGKPDSIAEIFARLFHLSSSLTKSDQRIIEFMVSALKTRANQTESQPVHSELYSLKHSSSTQLLYHLSPCFKLAFMAANLAIIESTIQEKESNSDRFHILDFDIGHGAQYANLLLALSSRQNEKKTIVKITTVAENGNEARLKKVAESLGQLGKRVGVSFVLNVVNQKLDELTRESLGCEARESLAVNFAFKLYKMPDESVSPENHRDELLRRVKGLSPAIVTLTEQEINTNTAPFTARVAESCNYYAALIDSLESMVPSENADRMKLEEELSRKISNSVAREGRDRVERCEVFGKWRARMGMAGFELKPLSQNITESTHARLSSWCRVNPGFTVKEESGGICFGWKGRTLTFASAWR